ESVNDKNQTTSNKWGFSLCILMSLSRCESTKRYAGAVGMVSNSLRDFQRKRKRSATIRSGYPYFLTRDGPEKRFNLQLQRLTSFDRQHHVCEFEFAAACGLD